MKPIVFEELKVGDKLITRDGRDARVLATDINDRYKPLLVAVNDYNKYNDVTREIVYSFTKQGRYNTDNDISNIDVFIKTKTVKRYVNLRGDNHGVITSCLYDNESDAIENGKKNTKYIKTIEIEVEI